MYNIEYEIISTGTERAGSRGYMSISNIVDGKFRFIFPIEHGKKVVDYCNSSLRCHKDLSIAQIVVSRFQLIPALAFQKNMHNYNRICIIGAGAVGVSSYFELLRLNMEEKVDIITRRKEFLDKFSKIIKNLKTQMNYEKYDCFIDCTGENSILYDIFDNAPRNSVIYLLGTPRDNPKINLLNIHRQNYQIIGGHELNGISLDYRRYMSDLIQLWYMEKQIDVNELVKCHSNANISSILMHNYIEPFHVININDNEESFNYG